MTCDSVNTEKVVNISSVTETNEATVLNG